MTPELTITTERIDDFPLLPEIMRRIDLPEIMDRHLKRHGLQRLSWGWIATIWLAPMLATSDHRKLPAHDCGFAQQVERPAELEQVIGGFDYAVPFQVGNRTLPGGLPALDPAHVQGLAQLQDQINDCLLIFFVVVAWQL